MSRQQAKDSRITVDAIYDDMNASMPVGENMPPFYALTYIIRKERL